MKQHLELGIIIAMSAMMVFGTAAFVMPYVYAVSDGSSTTGSSGANGAAGSSTGAGGAGGKGDNAGTTTGSGSTGGSSTTPKTPTPKTPTPKTPTPKTPTPKTPTPKTPTPKTPTPKVCIPGKCVGDPGYYTANGHHHCFDGAKGCICTDPHKCTVGSAFIRPDSIMTTV
jgi:hypothetical protein